ncbi:hypothetical protein D3C81_1201350 [compost metagenome]
MYRTEVSALRVDIGNCLTDHVNSVLRVGGSGHVSVADNGFGRAGRSSCSTTEQATNASTGHRVAVGGVQRDSTSGDDWTGTYNERGGGTEDTGTVFRCNPDQGGVGVTIGEAQVFTGIGFHRQGLSRGVVINADAQFCGVGLQLIRQIGGAGQAGEADGCTTYGQVEGSRSCSSSSYSECNFSTGGCTQTTYSTVQLGSNGLGRITNCHGNCSAGLTAACNSNRAASQTTSSTRCVRYTFQLLRTNVVCRYVAQSHVDGLVGVSTHLESGSTERTVQQVTTTESSGGSDTGQLGSQSRVLGVVRLTVFGAWRAVRGSQSQGTHFLQDVGGFLHRAFSGLCDGDTVAGVLDGSAQAVDLAGQTVGDLQASGVVFSAVDTQAGGQALHRSLQVAGSFVQVVLNGQGSKVGVYC